MLPSRAASAFHAAVHDLKVQRLAAVAAKRFAPAAPTGDKFVLNMATQKHSTTPLDKSRAFLAMSKEESTWHTAHR